MRLIWLLLACRGAKDSTGTDDTSPGVELACPLSESGTTRSDLVRVDGVAIELHGDVTEGTEVPVVVLYGTFEPEQVPTDADRRWDDGHGLLQLHLDLPGAEGDPTTDGAYDRFGPESRAAVATALRYAAGELTDEEGCTLEDRARLASPPLLVGLSNGGNLAVATLADPDLERPELAGLVLWETPASAQFVTSELTEPEWTGCTFDGELLCTSDLSQAALDGRGVYLDRNESGAYDDDEPRFNPIRMDNGYLYSPSLHEALGAQEGLGTLPQSEAWWTWRQAANLADQALGNHPDLPLILVASRVDHVQRLTGSPHVIGMGIAWQQAGGWVRLNPDANWSEMDENEAGAGLDFDAPGALLLGSGTYDRVLWGVLELVHRVQTDDWSADL